jgi:SAM-dependent methyltransferase
MERIIYDRMAALDQTHWWYVARRQVLSSVIRRTIKLPKDARILEIGCGTGHNFEMLGAFGKVDGLEMDDAAREFASERLGRPVGSARLPELDGIAEGSYDLIALLDVLEHVETDHEALASIRTKLKPGGHILLTVPANRWMWSAHDRVHHHFRRYNDASLRQVIAAAGLKPDIFSHFNTILFPLAATFRAIGKLTGREEADDAQPAAPLNSAFTALFGLERHLVGRVPMPFGVSLLAVLSSES